MSVHVQAAIAITPEGARLADINLIAGTAMDDLHLARLRRVEGVLEMFKNHEELLKQNFLQTDLFMRSTSSRQAGEASFRRLPFLAYFCHL